MTFGFTISNDHLPTWMYHRQLQPPDYHVIPVAGISWRDLAYGSFLLTMAMAIPLTFSRRVDRGEPELAIGMAAIRRWALLVVYALLVAHSNTFFTGYTNAGRVVGLIGFAVMALVFTRRRPDWSEERFRVLRRTGWVLAIAFLAFSPLAYGKTFSFARIDDIIADLAFMSFAGIVIWYATRGRPGLVRRLRRTQVPIAKLAILAAAVALYVGAKHVDWLQQWWYSSPVPWAFEPHQLSLLTIVVPGLIAGDLLLTWMRSKDAASQQPAWTRARLTCVAVLSAAFTPIVTVGLYNRYSGLTLAASIVLVAAGLYLIQHPSTSFERTVQSLFRWAALWLVIGLLLEPTEGGIKKEPETLTYFFTITGTTSMLLVSLMALTEGLNRKRWVQTLIDLGQNPLLCYVVFTVFLNSLFELIPTTRGLWESSPGLSVVRSVICTVLVVLLVRLATRKRIYWRA
jgi:hypothetical protein